MVTTPPVGEFGKWLYNQLLENRMTITDLAKRIQLTPGAVSLHIHHKRKPSYQVVKHYCTVFHEMDIFRIYEMLLRDYEYE